MSRALDEVDLDLSADGVALDHDEQQHDPRGARLAASVQHALRLVGPAEGGVEHCASEPRRAASAEGQLPRDDPDKAFQLERLRDVAVGTERARDLRGLWMSSEQHDARALFRDLAVLRHE